MAILKAQRPDLRILRCGKRGRHLDAPTLEILADDLAAPPRALVGASMGGATTLAPSPSPKFRSLVNGCRLRRLRRTRGPPAADLFLPQQ